MKHRFSSPLKGMKRPPEVIEKIKKTKNLPENIEHIKKLLTGKKRPQHVIEKIRRAAKGRVISPETKAKMSAVRKGKKLSPEVRAKRRGENNHRSVLNSAQVREIRKLYASGKGSHRSLAEKFGVGKSTITSILSRKSWGDIDEERNDS